MGEKEKKIVLLIGVGALMLGGFLAYSALDSYKLKLANTQKRLLQELKNQNLILEEEQDWKFYANWWERNQPKPSSVELMRDKLLNDAKAIATQTGMQYPKVARPNYLPGIKTNPDFHRARVSIPFSSNEISLYQWLAQINDPVKFRAVTRFRIEPNKEDATKVDGVAEVEQWILPTEKALEEAELEASN